MVGARWRIGSVGIVRAQCPWRRDVGCSIFLYPSGFPLLAVSGRVRLYHGVASGPRTKNSPIISSRDRNGHSATRYFRAGNRAERIGWREMDGFSNPAGRGEIWTVT